MFRHGKRRTGRGEGWASRPGTRDKVQGIGAVVATQAAKHDQRYISGIAAHPCKNARMGQPRFVMGKEEQSVGEGWASPHERRFTGRDHCEF
jgi:hypothetical protein